jgi:hypothetical protein
VASEIHAFGLVIPANTAIVTPVAQNFTMPQRVVMAIEVKVPPGPRGLVGFQLGSTGTAVIPAIPGTWVVTDDENILWPLENYIDSGSWQGFGYNLGQYTHTIQFRFLCQVPGITGPPTTALIDLSTLVSS